MNWKNPMDRNLWIKRLLGLKCKVFATYYIISDWNYLLKLLGDLHVSSGETLTDNEVNLMSMNYDNVEGDIQHAGFFPDEGKVIIESLSRHPDGAGVCKWKITLEVNSDYLERVNYWLGPSQIPNHDTWNKSFTKLFHGDPAEWGIR